MAVFTAKTGFMEPVSREHLSDPFKGFAAERANI
jgi:hypothetical protein